MLVCPNNMNCLVVQEDEEVSKQRLKDQADLELYRKQQQKTEETKEKKAEYARK